jgi:hypothetical protein
MKTMKKLLSNRLASLSTKRVKKQMVRPSKKYLVFNEDNPHDLFEVEATDPNTAAHAALTHLGWWLAEDQYIRS